MTPQEANEIRADCPICMKDCPHAALRAAPAEKPCVCHEGSVCTEACGEGKCHGGCNRKLSPAQQGYRERAETAEAERDALKEKLATCQCWKSEHCPLHSIGIAEAEARVMEQRHRAEAAERERDAYKKAKAENDERFMLERDEARAKLAEAEKALAKLNSEGCCCDADDHECGQSPALKARIAELEGALKAKTESAVMAQMAVRVLCEEFKDSPKWREGLHDKIAKAQDEGRAALSSPRGESK